MKKTYLLASIVFLVAIACKKNDSRNTTASTNKSIVVANEKTNTATQMSHHDSLKIVVDNYYKFNKIVFQKGSTVEDIDNIFDLFTEDFVYIHPKYGGTYTRENLYNGYIRNQKNGGYDGSVTDIRIDNIIIGRNAVVTEKRFIKGEEIGNPEMTLFEFRNGKIFKIFEYW